MATVDQVYRRHFKPETRPGSFEVWSWFFMRISGVLLVFLVLGHMAVMHVLGGGVERINFEFVAARWEGIFWRTYDWFLLVFALIHGGVGARVVIQDYIRKDQWRVLLKALLYTAVFLFLGLGTLVIVTFDVSQMPGG